MSDMSKLDIGIPHVISVKRKTYTDVYFKVHVKDRPEGWAASIHLGRTDKIGIEDITRKAKETYDEYMNFKGYLLTGLKAGDRSGTLPHIITLYKKSPFWTNLTPRTKRDYETYLKRIREWSEKNAHPHIKDMTTPHIVKWLNTMEDTPVLRKRAKSILKLLCDVAINEGYIADNPAEKITLATKKRDKRKVVLWTESDVDAFVAEADKRGLYSLGSIVLTMIETAQRKGDVIKMRNKVDYNNGELDYEQSKTGARVQFPATKKLFKRYEAVGIGDLFMFINEKTKRPWNEYGVTHTVREICDHLGMPDHIIMHLRHSQIYYLYELGLSYNEIAAITGHSENTVQAMLNRHYLEIRNKELATQGIAKINKARGHS